MNQTISGIAFPSATTYLGLYKEIPAAMLLQRRYVLWVLEKNRSGQQNAPFWGICSRILHQILKCSPKNSCRGNGAVVISGFTIREHSSMFIHNVTLKWFKPRYFERSIPKATYGLDGWVLKWWNLCFQYLNNPLCVFQETNCKKLVNMINSSRFEKERGKEVE